MVVSAYGSGTTRPLIKSSGENAVFLASDWNNYGIRADHLAYVGIEFREVNRSGTASAFFRLIGGEDLLIEDCKIVGFGGTVIMGIQGQGAWFKNLRIRRCVIADAWSSSSHSQGLYLEYIDGLLLEENVFDHNGWHDTISGAERTMFNHGVYVNQSCTGNTTVRNNIFANSSATGIQMRPGGV
ncbi:MAG: right-handed parallel beta-helix repeat-containing protein, partial [Planctomycetota bacterium]